MQSKQQGFWRGTQCNYLSHERRDCEIWMHQSLKPNVVQRSSPKMKCVWENKWFGEGQNSYLSQARLLKISVQYCKSSAEPLKRPHSSKCQQQTLNIQRRAQHSGVLSCFPSECKNNVKQQPALLLSNLWQVIEIPDLALQCPATFKLTS